MAVNARAMPTSVSRNILEIQFVKLTDMCLTFIPAPIHLLNDSVD